MLVVDDDETIAAELGLGDDYECLAARSVGDATAFLEGGELAVVLIDEGVGGGAGIDLARAVLERSPTTSVIVMTSSPSLDTAREVLHLGVVDYLEKPFSSIELATRAVDRAFRLHILESEKDRLRAELVQRNRRLEELSVRDPLTGLFNHAYLQHSVEAELRRSQRYDKRFSLVLIDLDGFRAINVARGHREGDRVLAEVAAILDDGSRSFDVRFRLGEGGVLARYGGDVFAMLLPETPPAGAMTKAERVRDAIAEVRAAGLTVSVAVASFPDDGREHGALLESLDRALLVAKRRGGNCVVAHSAELAAQHSDTEAAARKLAERARILRSVIASSELDFAYQPIVSSDDLEVYAFEALVRPRNRAVFPNPSVLIETACATGQLIGLGRVLRRRAMAGLARIPEPICLFVNLHPDELSDFVTYVDDLSATVDARRIVLELTEVAGIRDYDKVRAEIATLREAGFRIALDDLGAGYSGLSALARLEPDFVKLDMALVHSIAESPRSRRLAKHIVEFAGDEGMAVVAEGIEVPAQLDVLRELGCQLFQGYLLGRPGPLAGDG